MHVRRSKGNENHLSIILGDWNTPEGWMQEDVKSCLYDHAPSMQGEAITAEYQEKSHHGVFFHGRRQWGAEGDNHGLFSPVINAFKSSWWATQQIETGKGEHYPLLVTITRYLCPAATRASLFDEMPCHDEFQTTMVDLNRDVDASSCLPACHPIGLSSIVLVVLLRRGH